MLKQFYDKENSDIKTQYLATINTIEGIFQKTKNYANSDLSNGNFYRFFHYLSKFVLKISTFEKKLESDYFTINNFEKLKKDNNELHEELLPENYESSYHNPAFSYTHFGKELGPVMSFYYGLYRKCIFYALNGKKYRSHKLNIVLVNLFNYIDNEKDFNSVDLISQIKEFIISDSLESQDRYLFETFNPEFNSPIYISKDCDLEDLRYLFRYGDYISDNEITIAKFLNKYSEEGLIKLAKLIAKAFKVGFSIGDKDMSSKSTVGLNFCIGQERIIRFLIPELKKMNLTPFANGVNSFAVNKQFFYDHRFDNAIWMNTDSVEQMLKFHVQSADNNSKYLRNVAGDIVLINFGEIPFTPIEKVECICYTEEQQKLLQTYKIGAINAIFKYKPRHETSFTALPFPTPQIGKDFEDIYRDILKVLMIDTDHYEEIQQKMIDVMDTADHVLIKGKDGNKTDMYVKLQKLENPNKETNFVNAGADINLPVGEVFTSPELEGTHGTLHIRETFLKGLKFSNLILDFKDGYISDYTCSNFDNDEENKKYIKDNLLFPHKSLTIGEFAIGTNTLAYMISRKYNILDVLHPLIIEKMGPHFAIGDTCFMMSEDTKIYNRFTNKEMTARENTKSCQRNKDLSKAYYFAHTDITLPYEAIDHISAIDKDGNQYPIIKDGYFVVQGTEEFNLPFDNQDDL